MKTLISRYDNRVITDTLSSINCARSLTVYLLLKYNEYEQIVRLEFNPFDYNDLHDARDSLLSTELLRKHEDLPTGIDLSATALEGFKNGEAVCDLTNRRLRTDRMTGAGTFLRAQRKISEVLGEFSADEMIELGGWGPGSTLNIRRRDATPTRKFQGYLEFTAKAGDLLTRNNLLDHLYPLWEPKIRLYEGNRVITVPKNAKTDRVIAVEPSGNLWFQKGIGTMIRKRLKRFGVDLNTQEQNQFLAQHGSRHGHLATVDFSAASDTISYQLVMDLLPWKWFQVLDLFRSPRGLVTDQFVEYEKFSSMGNGYTFELESLLFWAIAKAIIPEEHPHYKQISIYGDDLIIPADCIDECVDFFNFCGFKINSQKSFASSYYRESCGRHYWDGNDITPIYMRRNLKDLEVMRFHNRLVEYSCKTIGDGFRDKRFRSCITFLRSSGGNYGSCPLGYGDMGYIESFDEHTPDFCRWLFRGWYSKESLRVIPCKREFDDRAFNLSKLYHLWKSGDAQIDESLKNSEVLPQRVKYRLRRSYFADWPCLGAWI